MIMNNCEIKSDFHFQATGIGSVPFTDTKGTCLKVLKLLPDIPFWPQLVKRSHLEDMNIQFSEGLSFLKIDKELRSLVTLSKDIESELAAFYEHFLAEDVDYFAISRKYASGLYELIDLIGKDPERYGHYIKGQSVGPITFAASIKDYDGKSILYNPDLLDASSKGLAIKALWQAKELEKSGKKAIIFFDEPYLSGFGSAFSPIDRQKVVDLIREILDFLRERSDTLLGIHCCGNTDWSMIAETGPDIINFDAFSFMDYFMLYPEEISRFLRNGGTIAWGIVPTNGFTGEESVEVLYLKLEKGLTHLYEWGLEPEMVTGQAILTPACGMGTMDESSANRILDLLSALSKRCSDLG